MDSEIKAVPCPFCGNAFICIYDDGTEETAQCTHCRAQGPWVDKGGRAAVIMWNQRMMPITPVAVCANCFIGQHGRCSKIHYKVKCGCYQCSGEIPVFRTPPNETSSES